MNKDKVKLRNNEFGLKLHLGCGCDLRDGYVNIDWNKFPVEKSKYTPDINMNLCEFPWKKIPKGCAEEVLMIHVLEHLLPTNDVIQEISRVLSSGGVFKGVVPYGFSLNAFVEPDHVRFFEPWSFNRLAEIHGFEVKSIELKRINLNFKSKLRNFLFPEIIAKPLSYFIRNMYDEIHFVLVKK